MGDGGTDGPRDMFGDEVDDGTECKEDVEDLRREEEALTEKDGEGAKVNFVFAPQFLPFICVCNGVNWPADTSWRSDEVLSVSHSGQRGQFISQLPTRLDLVFILPRMGRSCGKNAAEFQCQWELKAVYVESPGTRARPACPYQLSVSDTPKSLQQESVSRLKIEGPSGMDESNGNGSGFMVRKKDGGGERKGWAATRLARRKSYVQCLIGNQVT
ncbi:hypothetical protein C8R44DRAFT_746005 [Mycena epipterygia]|nr:hypothetical protein C8R44DRAFT_746005 [Mycena epipterygia]